jgi:endonuclease YncB( thermonuclease family)
VYVIDGGTIRVAGKTVRLIGFDAPELGSHAHCRLERMLDRAAESVAADAMGNIFGAEVGPKRANKYVKN